MRASWLKHFSIIVLVAQLVQAGAVVPCAMQCLHHRGQPCDNRQTMTGPMVMAPHHASRTCCGASVRCVPPPALVSAVSRPLPSERGAVQAHPMSVMALFRSPPVSPPPEV